MERVGEQDHGGGDGIRVVQEVEHEQDGQEGHVQAAPDGQLILKILNIKKQDSIWYFTEDIIRYRYIFGCRLLSLPVGRIQIRVREKNLREPNILNSFPWGVGDGDTIFPNSLTNLVMV